METKQKTGKKSEVIFGTIGVFILILAVIGISYAIWSKTFLGTKENSLKTGYVSFSYSEADNSYISLENALPISDKQGKELSGAKNVFDFNVSASYKGVSKIKYDIFAESVDNNTLPEEFVKVYLTDQNDNPVEGYEGDNVPLYEDLQNYNYNGKNHYKLLHSGYLTEQDSNKNFRLRIWLSSDFTDGSNQLTFSFKVNVKGMA